MPSATTPLGRGPGRRRRGSPESEDPPVAHEPRTPRGRRIRGQTARSADRSLPRRASGGARRHGQGAGRGQDTHALRPDRGDGDRVDAARGARAGVAPRRALLPRHHRVVRPLRRPGRPLRRRRVERVGVQGERRLAAGRRRQGPAGRRRPRALVLRDVRADRRPADAARAAGAEEGLLHGDRLRRQRQAGRRLRADVARRLQEERGRVRRRGLLPRQAHGAPDPRDRDRRRPLERRDVTRLALLLAALALAGCGARESGHGSATLWVTRDRGAHVLFAGAVPAGLNAIQTVERKLKVSTRYGGRYVQSIDGIDGSLSAQRDWFYFVDGVEGNRSAADVRLRPGDILWWDYRNWTPATEDIPVVAGAYPHPFVDGDTRVAGDPALARAIARQVHGTVRGLGSARNVIVIDGRVPPGTVRIETFHGGYRLDLGTGVARR